MSTPTPEASCTCPCVDPGRGWPDPIPPVYEPSETCPLHGIGAPHTAFPPAPKVVTEYGQLMSGGGYHVRNPHPDIDRIYPLADWITHESRFGGRVYRRRLVVVEDWTEVTEP